MIVNENDTDILNNFKVEERFDSDHFGDNRRGDKKKTAKKEKERYLDEERKIQIYLNLEVKQIYNQNEHEIEEQKENQQKKR